jgi:PKD repeat protein
VAFNGSASSDDGSIASYAWTFGDGTTGTSAQPTHAYAAAGTFTATLTVTDNLGLTNSASATVTITGGGTTPVTLLADNFDDNSRDAAKWRLGAIMGTIYEGAAAADSLVSVLERNSRLEITPRTNVAGDRYYGYLSNALDLTGASARVQCVQVPGGSANALLSVTKDSQNFLLFGYESGYLFCDQTIAGQRDYTLINFNAAQHRHWRIRHISAGDSIVFETSPDAVTWTAQRTVARRLPLGSVTVELSGGSYQPEGTPGTVVFDNFAAERP